MIVTISYRLTSSQDSTDVTFSLTCNATGGPVSSVIWTRDGLLLDNTGPLVLINASTASYTNVLEVNNRTPGTYMCQIRANNQILTSESFIVHGMSLINFFFFFFFFFFFWYIILVPYVNITFNMEVIPGCPDEISTSYVSKHDNRVVAKLL